MRYRPFAHFNASVSAVSLALGDDDNRRRSAADWVALVYAALECGVNSFEIQGRNPAIVEALDQVLDHVERRLMFLTWRVGPRTVHQSLESRAFDPDVIDNTIRSALARTRFGYIDLLLLDDPGEHDLSPQALANIKDLKSQGLCRYIGVAGVSTAIDAYISVGAFDALALPYSMTSGWQERLRMRAAQQRDMAVIAYDFCPDHLHPLTPPAERHKFWKKKSVPAKGSAYEFLVKTPDWTSEEICLAFALQEPSIATVLAKPFDLDHLQTLAEATERSMPAGLSAQIEMARVLAGDESQQRRA